MRVTIHGRSVLGHAYVIAFHATEPLEDGVIAPILQMWKLRLKENNKYTSTSTISIAEPGLEVVSLSLEPVLLPKS